MVFEKIFAKLFGKKEEGAEAMVNATESSEASAVSSGEEIKVNAEIKSVDSMNVGGLEGVEPATKNLSEEDKKKIASFDEEPKTLDEEVAPAPTNAPMADSVEAPTPPMETPAEAPLTSTDRKNFGEVKTNDAGEIVTEIKTEEPTTSPEMEKPTADTGSGSAEAE